MQIRIDIWMIRNKDWAHLFGMMAKNISENGNKENNMELDCTKLQLVNIDMENGLKEKE